MRRIRTCTRTIHVLAIVHVLALGLVLVLGLRQELGRVLGLVLVSVFVRNLLKDTKNDILSTSSCTRIAIDAKEKKIDASALTSPGTRTHTRTLIHTLTRTRG